MRSVPWAAFTHFELARKFFILVHILNNQNMSLFNDTSLFTQGERKKEIYEPQDASLVLIESFFTKEELDRLYENLLKDTEWKTSRITIYGKQHIRPDESAQQ